MTKSEIRTALLNIVFKKNPDIEQELGVLSILCGEELETLKIAYNAIMEECIRDKGISSVMMTMDNERAFKDVTDGDSDTIRKYADQMEVIPMTDPDYIRGVPKIQINQFLYAWYDFYTSERVKIKDIFKKLITEQRLIPYFDENSMNDHSRRSTIGQVLKVLNGKRFGNWFVQMEAVKGAASKWRVLKVG